MPPKRKTPAADTKKNLKQSKLSLSPKSAEKRDRPLRGFSAVGAEAVCQIAVDSLPEQFASAFGSAPALDDSTAIVDNAEEDDSIGSSPAPRHRVAKKQVKQAKVIEISDSSDDGSLKSKGKERAVDSDGEILLLRCVNPLADRSPQLKRLSYGRIVMLPLPR